MSDPLDPNTWAAMISAVGFPTVAAGYFMFRDYKQAGRLTETMERVGERLAKIEERLEIEHDKKGGDGGS